MKETMDSNRKAAIIIGVLFIAATVAYSISVILLTPILTSPDYLTLAAEKDKEMVFGSFLVLIDAVAVAGIGIVIYPILKKYNETLALGFTGARLAEGVLFAITVVPILLLLTLSREFVEAGIPDEIWYQTTGTLLVTAHEWIFLLGFAVAFTISSLILNFTLYSTRLVPRWISAWGFAGAALLWVYYLLQAFNVAQLDILFIPIAVQEMVFAVWLIVKGFNSLDETGQDSRKADQ